ncbi:hypothetical protein [uncultured Tenacibaculum sp.]|uniref:hypothetical protein n=1 Tax=uncultured Tenacibaculum sp. TaxID=174713 RepID=UPI0026296E68|nr:hypothetical protein [uncultured Tenacibaculum sp.]
MKKIKILILLIFTTTLAYSQQKEFEKVLGKKNIETLNFFLNDFENNVLKNKYPKLEIKDAYKEFLTEIVKEKITLKKVVSTKMKNTFNKSILKKHIFCISDSVYVGKSNFANNNKKAVITKYKCLKANNKVIETKSEFYFHKELENIESVIQRAKNSDQPNLVGLFLKALKAIKVKSNFIKYYIDFTETIGDYWHPIIMSDSLLKNQINLDNYIIKRLILINIIYR